MERKYNYIYRITNLLNNMIYIGVHCTDDLDDGYMGSGKYLIGDMNKIGAHYFKKEILEFFETYNEACQRESEIVDERFVKRKDTYNLTTGGGSFYHTRNTVLIKTEKGFAKRIPIDEFWKNKDKYETFTTGKVLCRTKEGENKLVSISEYRTKREEYITPTTGKMPVKIRETGKNELISVEDFDINRHEYISPFKKNYLYCKDENGNILYISRDDERLKNGELVSIWCGKKHNDESKRKIGMKNAIHQMGEKNANYGKCWIYNDEMKKSMSIKKDDIEKYIAQGWKKGRKIKF